MGAGDVPGFQRILQQAMPQQQGQMWGMSNPPVPLPQFSGAPAPAPTADPAAAAPQPKLVQLQEPPMPGTVTTTSAARTMGLDRQELARRLAAIEGGGTAAYELLREQEDLDSTAATQAREDHDKAVTNFFKSIDAGDVYSAQYWAAQSGMDIGPEVYADAEAMRLLGIAGKYKSFYGADVESFGRFVDDAFKRHAAGDANAFQSAFTLNRPKRVTTGRILSPENQTYQALLQKHGGNAVEAYKEWKALGAKSGGGSATTFEQRKEFAAKLYPNDLQAQANFINGGRTPTRTELRKLAVDEMTKRYGNNMPRGEEYTRQRDALMQEYESMAWTPGIPPDEGNAPEEEIDFGTQGRIPTAENNVHEADLPGVGPIYSNDGQTWYDADGNQITQ